MVKIIDEKPDPSVVKHRICRNCGVKLEYVPRDVKRQTYYSMGESDIDEYIVCPNCKEKVSV